MAKLKVPAQLFRTAEFERESVDIENRTVRLSVSSDAPYERYFGKEILRHDPGSIRMGRLQKAGAFLFNHNRDAHIGRIISASADGQKLNVVARFGNSALANEKFQDVQDGILREASIGYEIHKMEEDSDTKTFTATDWEPYECSLVTVPADYNVGIGRSEPDWQKVRSKELDLPGSVDNSTNSETTRTPTPPMAETVTPPAEVKIDVVSERKNAVADHISRCEKIDSFVDAIKQTKWQETAREIAKTHKKGDANFEQFRADAVNAFDPAKHIDIPDTNLGLSKKERKNFSLCRLLMDRALGRENSFELEACDAAREKLREFGDTTISKRMGVTLPEDVTNSNLAEDHDLDSRGVERALEQVRQLQVRTSLQASTQNLGGYLIGTDIMTGSLIELLRNRALVSQMGIVNLSGLVNNVAIPRVLTGSTVYWAAEAANMSGSNQTFGQLTLTPKRMGADVAYTKQLVAQASLSVEAFVRDDMAKQMAVELDRVYINGTGIGGEPQGILNTTGVGTVTFSTAATWDKLLTFEKDVAAANADALGAMAFLTTPTSRYKWKQICKIGTTFPNFLWDGGNNPGEVNGYPAYCTNNVPGNKVIFGAWSEFIAAMWAGLDLVVDNITGKRTETIEITAQSYHDCGIRHPLAFDVSTDSGAQ